MDAKRFDTVSRLFANRRLSRRQAFALGSAGALAATGLTAASAQEATPSATDAEKVEFLFVQSFQSGSIAPKAGEADTYTLTLEQGLGQTIYFSDRPERTVGASPTAEFLKGLGFSQDNPPNAALVVEPEPGKTDIAVVELFNPRYDETSHTATYDVQVLKDYEQAIDMSFAEQPTDLADLQAQFGAAHLFIDDCESAQVACCSEWDNYNLYCKNTYVGYFPTMGYCYDAWAWHCTPMVPYCHDGGRDGNALTYKYWANQCNDTFSECNGICYPIFYP
jgi:hypothetical protein